MDPILPADRCVVEVLETVEIDDRVAAGVRHLKQLGYRIALDDFLLDGPLVPLLPLADFVKLDCRALGEARLRDHVRALRPYGARLLAEKIESEIEFERCRKLGCELFQGYYLPKAGGADRPADSVQPFVGTLAAGGVHRYREFGECHRGTHRARCATDIRPAAARQFRHVPAPK